jgi:hypothetical protein
MTNQPIDHPWLDDASQEALDEGGTWLLELVSAVDYLKRGIRPGLNVWDAIEEALRDWTTEVETVDGGAPDPDTLWTWNDPLLETLRRAVHTIEGNTDLTASEAFQRAIRHWAQTMADRFNSGHRWPQQLSLTA